jgi:hypothetical protein
MQLSPVRLVTAVGKALPLLDGLLAEFAPVLLVLALCAAQPFVLESTSSPGRRR